MPPMDVKNEMTIATKGGSKTFVLTPDMGNRILKKSTIRPPQEISRSAQMFNPFLIYSMPYCIAISKAPPVNEPTTIISASGRAGRLSLIHASPLLLRQAKHHSFTKGNVVYVSRGFACLGD